MSEVYDSLARIASSTRKDIEDLFCITESDISKGVRTTYLTSSGIVEEYFTEW